MPLILPFVAALLMFFATCAAFAADEPEPAARTLETVVVSGVQPGPGLWQVTKDNRTMWILGTLRPLPKRMTWESREVVEKIAQSQEVLMTPSAQINVEGGRLRALFLVPSLLKARNNPDGRRLVDVVPADLYERWLALKRVHLKRNNSVEKRRPIIAAWTLYEKAIERSGMSFDDIVTRVVEKAARKHDVPVNKPRIKHTIAAPKQALREFAGATLDDVECFRRTLTRLESDVETMKERGNAWATGDIVTLRELPYTDQNQACLDAVLKAGVADKHGLADLERRVDAKWLEAAEAALAKHRVTFAVLPIGEILDPEGYVEQLRDRGYVVTSP
ncbi:MAG TPA: TraB/GumN family protein [Candidatus Saccharimonadia bacterium]|nr:TraB/GumN family protein [Candidatus Saccharimonadia bacterium]